jgi:hypothetical protein
VLFNPWGSSSPPRLTAGAKFVFLDAKKHASCDDLCGFHRYSSVFENDDVDSEIVPLDVLPKFGWLLVNSRELLQHLDGFTAGFPVSISAKVTQRNWGLFAMWLGCLLISNCRPKENQTLLDAWKWV